MAAGVTPTPQPQQTLPAIPTGAAPKTNAPAPAGVGAAGSSLKSAGTAEKKAGYCSKLIDCLRKIPILGWLINCCFPKKDAAKGKEKPAPVEPKPLPADQNSNLVTQIKKAFETSSPATDAEIADLVKKFEGIKDLRKQVGLLADLQKSPHCVSTQFDKFVKKLSADNQKQLYQHITAVQGAVKELPDVVMNNHGKGVVAIAGMEAWIVALDKAADACLSKNVTDALSQANKSVESQQNTAVDFFKKIGDAAAQLAVVKTMMTGPNSTDSLVVKFVNALPDASKNDFFNRIQAKHKAIVDPQNVPIDEANEMLKLTGEAELPRVALLPGEEYFKAAPRGKFARQVLNEMTV